MEEAPESRMESNLLSNTNKLYYSIGEVAGMLKVAPSLIRHWEGYFPGIRPRRNLKGNRTYTREDILLLQKIYHFVKEKGYTLKGASEAIQKEKKETSANANEAVIASLTEIRSELEALRDSL
jgi:DNA-binding transcriptional MerR regulator